MRGPSGISNTQWLRRAAGYARTIAEAIHYAHQRGTLHRDLKPSNVLIDAHDQPRITDFGLAKRVESKDKDTTNGGDSRLSTQDPSQLTLSGQVLGSPNFMPPEQAAGKRGQVGPHSDVYSLGAILYHLLTARPPFLAETLSETLQQVQHADPIAPRLLNPAVPRDLETICLKCLEKELRQRYANAQALADDLGRFLNGEPVHARPIGPAGKAARWCRRKPALAAALAACALVLVSGLAGITWQWRRAEQNAKNEERQRQRAEENAARSEQVAQFLKTMLEGVDPSNASGRDTSILRQILGMTAKRLDTELKGQPAVKAELRNTIGLVYHALAESAKAEAMHRQALALRKRLFGNEHQDVAASLNGLACSLEQQGEYAQAEQLHREALAMDTKLLGNEHPDVATSLNGLALTLHRQGKNAEAEDLWRDALAIRKKEHAKDHRALARVFNNLASGLIFQRKLDEAEKVLREALAALKKDNVEQIAGTASLLNNLAYVLSDQGKYGEAETMFREALAVARKLYGNDHPNVASILNASAKSMWRQGHYAEAEAASREALAIQKRRLGEDHPAVADSLNDLATALSRQGDLAQAEALHRESLAISRKRFDKEHPAVAVSLKNLAYALYQQQKYAEAEPLYREVLQSRQARLGVAHEEAMANLARMLSDWAWSERPGQSGIRTPKPEMERRAYEAEGLLRDCLAVRLRGTNANHWRTGDVRSRLGGALFAVAVTDSALSADARESKFAEAEAFLLVGYERLWQSKSADTKSRGDAVERLVRLYEAWDAAAPNTGKLIQAEEWKKKLEALPAE